MTCLHAWRKAQKAQEAEYGGGYAPQVAQDAWRASVEREYNASRARIEEEGRNRTAAREGGTSEAASAGHRTDATRDAGSAPAVAATALLAASDCSNMTCLHAWRKAQKAQEAEYGGGYAPQVAQDAWRASVEREYNASMARIEEERRNRTAAREGGTSEAASAGDRKEATRDA